MFDILMYLFENYVHSEVELLVDEDELTKELTRAGFHQSEILKALTLILFKNKALWKSNGVERNIIFFLSQYFFKK